MAANKPASAPAPVDKAAEREEIEDFVDRRVIARGSRVYHDTYTQAKAMKESKATADKIREALLRKPNAPAKDKDGLVPLPKRKEFEAEKRMSSIRDQAIKDAIKGKPASYR
ncbi:hypothetical protein [Planctomyces sp. SH-PL14]|uniref:hypothetical protein n=1 Tax=Planctomyces sp. SH-PL14 TaxID=1632864 RepID=UPI00078EABD4|nr:hypothetical protein [Planctomyces sp. SH-PL14]AMV21434.1 hypothetical protein VT03_26260 [Planctomyces sp. SH-PL14]